LKYNRRTYKRYEFSLGIDSKLNALVEKYKSYPNANLTHLLKTLLCSHFGISIDDADSLYPAYFITKEDNIPNTELDKYFTTPIA